MPGVVVLGSLNVDHIVGVATLPAPGETVLSNGYSVAAGGKGRNQAAAVAALGGTAHMAGAVGDDSWGRWLRDDIASRGVDHSQVETIVGEATGLALITVDSAGENTIVVHPGANARAGAVPAGLFDRIRPAALLCSLEVPLEAVAASVSAARACGVTAVVNAAPMVGADDGRLAPILSQTDILVVNRSEASRLAGAELRAAERPEVIVTLGPEGAVHVGTGGERRFPAFPVRSRSTVGAGDTFAGGLALALAEGRPLNQAIVHAMAASAAFLSGDLSPGRVRAVLSGVA